MEYNTKLRRKRERTDNVVSILLAIVVLVVCLAFSWIINCGIIKLITMCFGLKYKWSIATGIWLIIIIAKSIFKNDD